MNNEKSMANINWIKSTYTQGRYYNPASDHYLSVDHVVCDQCKRTHIDKCIGWEEYDLCISCVRILYTTETFYKVSDEVKKIMSTESTVHNTLKSLEEKERPGYVLTSIWGKKYDFESEITCNRCKKQDGVQYIKWQDNILCIECTTILKYYRENPSDSLYSSYPPLVKVSMMQNQFITKKPCIIL